MNNVINGSFILQQYSVLMLIAFNTLFKTLVRKGGITNHHSLACSLSNISAKNYQNRLMCIEVIVCNISVVFETQCISLH